MNAQEVYRDVESTLGIVPEFIRAVPPEAVEGFWLKMKNFQLGETAIPGKYKELIGLAVAATIPCEYCVHFHKESARMHGATDAEVREAILQAALTREGSTILNGLQQDPEEFRAEFTEMMRFMKSQQAKRPGEAAGARTRG